MNFPSFFSKEPAVILDRRKQAFDSFNSLKIPLLKYGLGVSVSFSPNFDSIVENVSRVSSFGSSSNDSFKENISDGDGVIICDWKTALQKYPEKVSFFGSFLDVKDKFESFHLSLVENIRLVLIPDCAFVSYPIILSPFSSDGKNVFTHTLVWVGKNASCTIVEEMHADNFSPHSNSHSHSPAGYHSHGVEIMASENSVVHFLAVQNVSKKTNYFSFKRARAEENARVDWFSADFGSSFCKSDVVSFLAGKKSCAVCRSVFFGNEKQVFDLNSKCIHFSPFTESLLLAKGCLDGNAKAVFHGLIKSAEYVPGAIGNQRIDCLLLSKDAEADPIPSLEIEGNDMRCSHASATGRINSGHLFYLMSRGLDEQSARLVLIRGFFDSLLLNVPNEYVEGVCRRIISERLKMDFLGEVALLAQ